MSDTKFERNAGINTAGASSGAWLGLFICIAGTCGVVVYKKKKGSIQV